jgi:hypothetical protein
VSAAIILALAIVIFLPKNKGYSLIFVGFAGGHLLILFCPFAGWLAVLQKLIDKMRTKKRGHCIRLWLVAKWLYSFLIASVLIFLMALYFYFAASSAQPYASSFIPCWFLHRLIVGCLLC